MPEWKKIIFMKALKARMQQENKMPEQILSGYTKLSESEKAEILESINTAVIQSRSE